MYFLLDTNIFIDFVKDGKDEHFIDQVLKLVEEGTVQLLVPDVLLLEWTRKKEQTLEYISNTFSTTANLSVLDTTGLLLKDNYAYSKERAANIDKLLNKGTYIKTPPKVKVDTVDRSIIQKAPFHDRKTKSINDALIYFTSINYLKKNKITRFVFVTKDSGDFGSKDNKNEILHKDLHDTSLETLYFTSLYKCFDKLKEELQIKQHADKEGLYQIVISRRGHKNILDHLYEVIITYKSKINFLPTYILARIDPFRVIQIKDDYSYHAGSTLLTNNKALIDFFKEVDIKKMRFKRGSGFSNTKKNLEKLDYIVTALNENLVFYISYITRGEQLNIHKDVNTKCSCVLCMYQHLSFGHLITEVYNEKDELKRAFVLFQLGKFEESLVVYHNIYQNAIKEENKVLSYRILLILHWVAQHADYQMKESKEIVLLQKVKSIDRERAFLSALNGTKLDREIVLFLNGNTMIDHYKLKVKEYTEKIREHYQSQLKANYSSNSNLQNLIYEFLNFEMFTIYNGMTYTKYSDFEDICGDFVEGIFISCALNQYQSSRIEYLDDYLLEKLVFYGKAEKMIVHFNRLIKKPIPYQSKERNFEKLVWNFLNAKKETIDKFSDSNLWEGSASFYRIFWNILLLLSIVEFDDNFIVNCAKKVFVFLEGLPKRETHQLNHLASFINSKGKILKKDILNHLFKCVLENPHLHNEDIFHHFSSIEGYKFELNLSKKEFENIINMFFNKCDKCGEFHKNALFHIYPILPIKYKTQVKRKVIKQLAAEVDWDLYYLSVMADIINYKLFFDSYLKMFTPPERTAKRRFFLEGELHYRYLNNLMNLVFKTKAKLPRTFITQFTGLSDYYDWVMNMKTFDYTKFQPNWILQYASRFYLEEAFSVENVRIAVRKFLKVNNQPTLAYYYSQYVK